MNIRFYMAALLVAALALPHTKPPENITVRNAEGLVHGFLSLSTLEGELLADGDLIQFARGDRVTSRVVFHFKDGSLHDETVVFLQREKFQLVSDHLVQRGPAFKQAMEVSLDAANGQIRVIYIDEEGKEKIIDEGIELPADAANGLIFTLLKNINPETPETEVSFVATTPKPRLVKLQIKPAGEEAFSIAGAERKAMHYVVKIDIGGIAGLIAPLIGKQPPDYHVWILGGEAPAFVKMEGPLYVGGPLWRIELASPVWPAAKNTKQ